jgi:tRNA (Thr-GGU) A37 N-methylase
MTTSYEIRPIGHIESSLVDREGAPKQGFEGAPDAWLVFELGVPEGLRDLAVGDEVFVLTWLHRARRDVLAVHPGHDPRNPETGVFSTRSQDRPNPIGLHRVRIAATLAALCFVVARGGTARVAGKQQV